MQYLQMFMIPVEYINSLWFFVYMDSLGQKHQVIVLLTFLVFENISKMNSF
jgi:hypothetical protein